MDRKVVGDMDWTRYELVLEVPEQADSITYGAPLFGNGTAWINGLKMEGMGDDVPITGRRFHEGIPLPKANAEPVNLDFRRCEREVGWFAEWMMSRSGQGVREDMMALGGFVLGA